MNARQSVTISRDTAGRVSQPAAARPAPVAAGPVVAVIGCHRVDPLRSWVVSRTRLVRWRTGARSWQIVGGAYRRWVTWPPRPDTRAPPPRCSVPPGVTPGACGHPWYSPCLVFLTPVTCARPASRGRPSPGCVQPGSGLIKLAARPYLQACDRELAAAAASTGGPQPRPPCPASPRPSRRWPASSPLPARTAKAAAELYGSVKTDGTLPPQGRSVETGRPGLTSRAASSERCFAAPIPRPPAVSGRDNAITVTVGGRR